MCTLDVRTRRRYQNKRTVSGNSRSQHLMPAVSEDIISVSAKADVPSLLASKLKRLPVDATTDSLVDALLAVSSMEMLYSCQSVEPTE
jgi:hypothetical protein